MNSDHQKQSSVLQIISYRLNRRVWKWLRNALLVIFCEFFVSPFCLKGANFANNCQLRSFKNLINLFYKKYYAFISNYKSLKQCIQSQWTEQHCCVSLKTLQPGGMRTRVFYFSRGYDDRCATPPEVRFLKAMQKLYTMYLKFVPM
jgi:hypothetical protein